MRWKSFHVWHQKVFMRKWSSIKEAKKVLRWFQQRQGVFIKFSKYFKRFWKKGWRKFSSQKGFEKRLEEGFKRFQANNSRRQTSFEFFWKVLRGFECEKVSKELKRFWRSVGCKIAWKDCRALQKNMSRGCTKRGKVAVLMPKLLTIKGANWLELLLNFAQTFLMISNVCRWRIELIPIKELWLL